jgi:hypothetical protein
MRLRLPSFVRVFIYEGEPTEETSIFNGTGKEYYEWIDGIEERNPLMGNRTITVRVRCIGLVPYEGIFDIPPFPEVFDLHRDFIVTSRNEKVLNLKLIFAGVIEP